MGIGSFLLVLGISLQFTQFSRLFLMYYGLGAAYNSYILGIVLAAIGAGLISFGAGANRK